MPELQVSVINLYRTKTEGPLKALADVQVGGTFAIRGIRVVLERGGLFVTLPQHQGKDKNWYDQIYFLDSDAFLPFKSAVLAAYHTAIKS